jgi:Xaa-Pro aminopeptidase
LSENGQVTDYYWHNVSHQLGLDVHDTADREALIQPGMVLTVEPGIYVPEWQVGLRIEDDVLVTGQGCENLSQAIPREAAEIEFALQNRPSQL